MIPDQGPLSVTPIPRWRSRSTFGSGDDGVVPSVEAARKRSRQLSRSRTAAKLRDSWAGVAGLLSSTTNAVVCPGHREFCCWRRYIG